MRTTSATRLAALTIVAGGVLVASCREPATGDPGPITLRVDVRTPNGSPGSTFCADGLALLLSIEEEGGEPLTFLYDTDGTTLYGCVDETGTVCADPAIKTPLPRPVKVTLEYIDVAPATYLVTGTFGVLCRGVADERVGKDLRVDDNAVTATVRLLRVGAVNPLFPPASAFPQGFFLAGSPAAPVPSSGNVARTGSGGAIVFAGGFALTGLGSRAIYRFDPQTVTLGTAGSLDKARGGLTATAIAETDGSNARVLFAGGASSNAGISFASAELYNPGSHTVAAIDLHHARSGHSAVYLEDYETADFGARPAVVLMAGCDIGVCITAPVGVGSKSNMEAFFLDRPATISSGACNGADAGAGSCTYAAAAMTCAPLCTDPPRSLAAAGPMKVGTQRAYVGQGLDRVSNTTHAAGFRLDAEIFTAVTPGSNAFRVSGTSVAILGTAELGFFGGYLQTNEATNQFMIVRGDTGETGAGNLPPPTMLLQRGSPTATALFDRRVLITGGSVGPYGGGNPSTSIEIHEPLPEPAGSFHFVARGPAICTDASNAGCEKMLEPRNGHAAVRIDGSLSWLNGAVVIAGGKARAIDRVAPEIFVPVYPCEAGQVPSSLQGRVDYCDRGRQRIPPTDPSAPPD